MTTTTVPTDAELLRQHLAGCTTSFTDLVTRHTGLLGWALHQAGVPVDERPDVLQEGLLKIHRTAATFRGGDSAASWLHTVMRNTALSHLRYMRRRSDELDRAVDLGEKLRSLPDHRTTDPVGCVHRIMLTDALRDLHPGLRDVIVLTDIHGWTLRETADHLGIPTGTVKSRRARGRDRLRSRLTAAGVTPTVVPTPLESSA